jgi:hypothetical protein
MGANLVLVGSIFIIIINFLLPSNDWYICSSTIYYHIARIVGPFHQCKARVMTHESQNATRIK